MRKKIVAVVEDDEATAELIKYYLEEEGYKIKIIPKGENFLEKIIACKPDLITMDVILPDSDGFQLFHDLLKDERTKSIPLIFITVKESEKDKGIKMGAYGYIVKPFKEKELKECINAILS